MDTESSTAGPGRGRISAGGGVLIVLVCVGAAAGLWYRFQQDVSNPKFSPTARMYVCAETHKPFEYAPKTGDKSFPVMSPFSHKLTGYPAEICNCGKSQDGRPVPTYVLLKGYEVGKPEPTPCPNCGALVTLHNQDRRPGEERRDGAASAGSQPDEGRG